MQRTSQIEIHSDESKQENTETPANPDPLGSGSAHFTSIRRQPVSIVSKDKGFSPEQTSEKTIAFRSRYYPETSDDQWNSWQWQVSNRISKVEQLKRFLHLSSAESGAFQQLKTKLPMGITPYYMGLLPEHDPDHPLRRSVIPTCHEFVVMPGEENDPLGEEHQSPVPGLVHRYPDRVLFLVTDFCSTYCRYCTRSRMVGAGKLFPSELRMRKAIEYIRSTPSVRDVLISGGDPLTLSNDRLDWLLTALREIPHVEIIRIGTKVPAVLPQRITPRLVEMLKKHHPLWMSLHFTHPDECTPESYAACRHLVEAGIPLGSQTVLLNGINDSVDVMKRLVHHLLKMRVRPYYLYQCDPIAGSGHFRTPVDKGIAVIQGLRGHTSGYAVPNYVIDAPGGGGKIPIMPNYVVGRTENEILLRNYQHKEFRYPDNAGN